MAFALCPEAALLNARRPTGEWLFVSGLAAPDHTVPYGTVLSGDAFKALRARATIVLSLRDEKHILLAQALIMLGFMGLTPEEIP
jgi:hypothetical protein